MKKPATIVIAGFSATEDCYQQSSIANLAMNKPSPRLTMNIPDVKFQPSSSVAEAIERSASILGVAGLMYDWDRSGKV